MSDQEKRFQQRLLATFKEEAKERTSAIAATLGELERSEGADQAGHVETVFREAHSLKAAARAVDQKGIEILCQAMESVFSALKRGEVNKSLDVLMPPLLGASDALSDFLGVLGGPADPGQASRAMGLARSLEIALARARANLSAPMLSKTPRDMPEQPVMPAPSVPDAAPTIETPEPPEPETPVAEAGNAPRASVNMADTVRLSVQRMGALLLQVEEMHAEKQATQQLAAALIEATGAMTKWKKEWAKMRASLPAQPSNQNVAGAEPPKALQSLLDWNETQISQLEARFVAAGKTANIEARNLGSKVDQLHQDMKKVLTQPCSTLLELFPRVVRDLARDQGKDVDLTIGGAALEVDRRILEELRDPLLHIVRNSIDHGIEKPADRITAGKPARASLTITASARDNDKVEFTVSDTGRGISTGKLAAAAVKMGLLTTDKMPSRPEDLLPLIFQSGISTSPILTDISGRGLGLAIVQERVERMGGSIAVETEAGKGTAFRILMPLTLAAYRGISVRSAGQVFVFPTLNVERVMRVERSKLTTVENRPVIDVEGSAVSLVALRDVLELPARSVEPQGKYLLAVVLNSLSGRIAFEVDAVNGDQEILVKPLGKCFRRVRNIQGAAILAGGAVAPILNVNDLLKSAVNAGRRVAPTYAQRSEAVAKPKNVLIAEDSITARGLLKNILESAGYNVKTAVDGLEAWAALKLETFDLLVSDVEMPGMNGFDLTARVRADKALSALPVVLVTALHSREDRERGADVGANAYIVKGGFERGRLLDAVKRLA